MTSDGRPAPKPRDRFGSTIARWCRAAFGRPRDFPAPDDVGQPRLEPTPVPAPPTMPASPTLAPEPSSPALSTPTPAVLAEPGASFDAAGFAVEILDVAAHLGSPELTRRLTTQLDRLPGVELIQPALNSEFDDRICSWDTTVATPADARPGTVAAVRLPGLAHSDGAVIRKALVTVFD